VIARLLDLVWPAPAVERAILDVASEILVVPPREPCPFCSTPVVAGLVLCTRCLIRCTERIEVQA
jgi:hypothetical protein